MQHSRLHQVDTEALRAGDRITNAELIRHGDKATPLRVEVVWKVVVPRGSAIDVRGDAYRFTWCCRRGGDIHAHPHVRGGGTD